MPVNLIQLSDTHPSWHNLTIFWIKLVRWLVGFIKSFTSKTEACHYITLILSQTLSGISAEKNSTVIFPIPIDIIKKYLSAENWSISILNLAKALLKYFLLHFFQLLRADIVKYRTGTNCAAIHRNFSNILYLDRDCMINKAIGTIVLLIELKLSSVYHYLQILLQILIHWYNKNKKISRERWFSLIDYYNRVRGRLEWEDLNIRRGRMTGQLIWLQVLGCLGRVPPREKREDRKQSAASQYDWCWFCGNKAWNSFEDKNV